MYTPFALTKPVGANYRVAPEDTLKVKRALRTLGLCDPPKWGITETADMEMIAGLKALQSANGIATDGIMKPGGPTEHFLRAALWEADNGVTNEPLSLRLSSNVGENAPNRPEDVHAVTHALASIGYKANSNKSEGIADREFLGNINLFKRDFNLGDDSRIDKNSTAKSVLARVSRPSQQLAGNNVFEKRNARRFNSVQTGAMKRDAVRLKERNKRALSRRAAILNSRPFEFDITPNPNAKPTKPIHELHSQSQVKKFDPIIRKESKKHGVDPDLVRAIMYLETSRGWPDAVFEPFNSNKTIRPMNIHAEFWRGLGYTRDDLKDPQKNIEAGVRLLKAILDRTPNATIEKIATLYNYLPATRVNKYGASVARFYREKAWLK